MTQFSEATCTILNKAGWSEAYRHDTTEDERLLKAAGYPMFPVVLEFLHRFGGLGFHYPHPIMAGYEEFASFKITQARANAYLEHIAFNVEDIGRPLCFIGMCYSENMWMMMDEEGCVYTDYGNQMFFIGISGEDAIEALCTRRPDLDISERIVHRNQRKAHLIYKELNPSVLYAPPMIYLQGNRFVRGPFPERRGLDFSCFRTTRGSLRFTFDQEETPALEPAQKLPFMRP